MFKIDTENELLSFLKILSEEAVISSKKSLNEKEDYMASSFKERLKSEKESLYEQEEEFEEFEEELPEENPEDLEIVDEPESGGGEIQEPESEPEPEPEEKDVSGQEKEELKASLDALERFINALRAGKSLKDSTIEDQLELYFDRLGDDEKSLLVLFMREVSKILSGKIQGDAAINPNDEPYNLDVITSSEEESAPADEPPEEQEAEFEEEAGEEFEEEFEEDQEEEDTEPPIKVGEPQDLQEIRRKIIRLMNS